MKPCDNACTSLDTFEASQAKVVNQLSDEEWEVVQRFTQKPKASIPSNFEEVNRKLKQLDGH